MKNSINLTVIGQNIQKARLHKNITQDKLAEKCNVSTNYIGLIERGQSSANASLIIDICNILDITPNYIFGSTIADTDKSSIDILPHDISIDYLKLQNENKTFVNQIIHHLYAMQKKR